MLPFRQNIGSTVALALGILLIMAEMTPNSSGEPTLACLVTLGAILYRSAKIRKLYPDPKSSRLYLELLGLVLFLFFWLAQNDFVSKLALHPLGSIIAPLWFFTAYGIIFFKKLNQINS